MKNKIKARSRTERAFTVRDHFPKNTKAAVKMPVMAKDTTTAMTGCKMPPVK